jgi:hypothetical protein
MAEVIHARQKDEPKAPIKVMYSSVSLEPVVSYPPKP